MSLAELSIHRHVLAWMLSAVLVLFGLISYQRIGVDRFPTIEFPVVSVTTTLAGASPEIIDSSVTSVIENQVNSVPGIETIQSNSVPGVSIVTLTFDLDKDVDIAFNEVQAKINQALRLLPSDADPPVVAKVETNAQPIMWLSLQGDRTSQQLSQYARNVLKKQLETIPGVGEVRLGGLLERTIRVEIDPRRLAALELSPLDLIHAFEREHIQLPGGFLSTGLSERLIKLDLEFHSVEALRRLPITWRDGAPVHLEEVASVIDGQADYRRVARFNGRDSTGLGIVKIAGTNTVTIIEEVKRRLDEEIRPNLPPGMTLEIASDDSILILEMIHALEEHLVLGTLLAALVVFVFLKSFRSTVIIALSIPVSLFGAVAVMYFFGYTFNTLTLLAMLLLVGVVVDDSIVVLENIHRHRETIDPDPVSAAISGTRQVMFAILASTLTLVAIFAPVAFMGGIIGRFFESFAVVVTFGVLVSLFVALTLTPMLCSRYLSIQPKHGRLYHLFDRAFAALERGYRRLLELALGHRWKVILLTVATVLSSGFFFDDLGKGFAPEEDEGRFLVFFRAPLGSGIDYTDQRMREIEQLLAQTPEVATYFTAIGLGQGGQVNQGIAFVRMTPRDARSRHQSEVLGELRGRLAQLPGVRAFAGPVPIVSGFRGEPLQFVLTGPNLDQTAQLAEQLLADLGEHEGIGRIDLDLNLELPQVVLHPDRERIAAAGLSAREVAQVIHLLAGGINVAKYNDEPGDGQRYDIRLKAMEGAITSPDDLSAVMLRNVRGEQVRLDSLVAFEESLGPAAIGRHNMEYAAYFYATPSMALGDAVEIVERAAAERLPLGYQVHLLGEAEEMEKTVGYMLFAFVLAIVLLYMVLASQFNSFLQPLIIMTAQPLAIIGGVAALWLANHTLNVYSMIGLVLLMGLVAKNSILLVDLTNQLRAAGKPVGEALREACPIRLRPVLMTSITVILALAPAATGLGAGADTNGPLAVAVIGGMVTSTLLTLIVVPVVYSLLAKR